VAALRQERHRLQPEPKSVALNSISNAAELSWPLFAASMQTGRMQTRLVVDDPVDPDGNGKRMLLRLSDIRSLGPTRVEELLARPGVREQINHGNGRFLAPWQRVLGIRKLQAIADEHSKVLDPSREDTHEVSTEARRHFNSRQPDQRFELFAAVNFDKILSPADPRKGKGLRNMFNSRIKWKKADVLSGCELLDCVVETLEEQSDEDLDVWLEKYGGNTRIEAKLAQFTRGTRAQVVGSCIAAATRSGAPQDSFSLDVGLAGRVLRTYLLYLDALNQARQQKSKPSKSMILREFSRRYRLQ
jgi:hypothetical protein